MGSLIASSAGPRETPSFRHVQRFENIESDAILGGLRPCPSRESCPLRWYRGAPMSTHVIRRAYHERPQDLLGLT
jgi:hypothetical protein